MAAKVAQYVTVIDRSNKVIGNSRQFKDVFFEAKAAYQDRKAEIKAKKRVKEEEELQKAIRAVSIQDQTERGGSTIRPDGPRRQSTTHGRRSPPTIEQRPRAERIHSSASPRSSGHTTPREGARGLSLGEFNDQIYGPNAPPYAAQTPAPWEQQYDPYARGLVRSQTDVLPYQHQQQQLQMQHRPSHPMRSQSVDEHVDMDLAYGEYHPESLVIQPEDARKKELSSLVTRCKGLLDEADCAGHSAKAIIEHLQKNPDTLAAVGLTLAEISSVASKMAPGALAAIGKSAPAVMALLMSPQFLIAVGVGVGVTVIAIGGFKIIKKIKARGAEDDEINRHVGPGQAEAIDVRELSRIEAWRRGVPESVVGGVNNDETGSVISGTTVEGEFITPFAAQSMGHLPPGKSSTSRSKTVKKSSQGQSGRTRDMARDSESGSATGKSERKKKHRKHRSDGEDDTSSVNSKDSSGSTLRRAKTERSVVKVKKPSPLSRMFTTGTSTRG